MEKNLGHSGCSITYNNETIYKTTLDNIYLERLYKQANKQGEFNMFNMVQGVRSPKILSMLPDGFSMEFVNGYSVIDFLEISSKEYFDLFCDDIKQIILQYIDRSNDKIVNDELQKKVKDLYPFLSESLKEYFHNYLRNDIEIPVGSCHGDMTLTNIIFCENGFYLIDFLDSFIESPLIDMAKIRQDTYFGWHRLFNNRRYDAIRNKISCEYLDNALSSFFNKFSFYQRHYSFFQILNLCRIYPYDKNGRVKDKIDYWIKDILNNA